MAVANFNIISPKYSFVDFNVRTPDKCCTGETDVCLPVFAMMI